MTLTAPWGVVITSYSIHYTKLYEHLADEAWRHPGVGEQHHLQTTAAGLAVAAIDGGGLGFVGHGLGQAAYTVAAALDLAVLQPL